MAWDVAAASVSVNADFSRMSLFNLRELVNEAVSTLMSGLEHCSRNDPQIQAAENESKSLPVTTYRSFKDVDLLFP